MVVNKLVPLKWMAPPVVFLLGLLAPISIGGPDQVIRVQNACGGDQHECEWSPGDVCVWCDPEWGCVPAHDYCYGFGCAS